MRDPRKNYIIVGTFLTVLLAALVVWLAVLSGRTEATDPYYMHFDNVMGLIEGAQVLYEGYPVGQIEEIFLTNKPETPTYRLNVSIRAGWAIPDDSMAVITQAGFLSAVVVDIHAGASNRLLKPGDEISSLGAKSVLSTITSVATKIEELSETNLKPLLENLTEGTSPLKDIAKDIPIILENLKIFSIELKNTTHEFKTFLARNTGRVDTILSDVEVSSGNISGLISDFRQTGKQLDDILATMNTLVSKNSATIDHSITDLHYTLEVLANHIRQISSNLESTTRNMNEFSAEIRRDPSLILRGRE